MPPAATTIPAASLPPTARCDALAPSEPGGAGCGGGRRDNSCGGRRPDNVGGGAELDAVRGARHTFDRRPGATGGDAYSSTTRPPVQQTPVRAHRSRLARRLRFVAVRGPALLGRVLHAHRCRTACPPRVRACVAGAGRAPLPTSRSTTPARALCPSPSH